MVHKNVPTQILALCSLSNVVIHVLEKPELPYLRHCTSPIIQHGSFLEHNVFIRLLLSMNVNMYISLTECFPMMVTESISAGIPALTSATSAIYSEDKILEEFLVVNELDTPDLIAGKASREWKIFIQGMPQTALPSLPSVLLNVSVPPVDIQRFKEVKPTVVFVTYELYPISTFGGGAGVVISGLVVELLEAGHDVVVIVDMNEAMPKNYIDYVQKVTDKNSRLSVYDAGTVLRQAGILSESKSVFLTKSRIFARALDLIYRQNPFDIIECFDYAGVCYELLRHQYVLQRF
ncbi:hypothetical protein BKA69DRAFT_207226 [Paraphysoderma sedebokerense]|nr:hypothetical protein BKA69DRAFT_207226 [Paraphysoderma sedebokerense]